LGGKGLKKIKLRVKCDSSLALYCAHEAVNIQKADVHYNWRPVVLRLSWH
jgi:hypothetical protein